MHNRLVYSCCFSPALPFSFCVGFFFFNDTATTEIYTLSLHDALPICFAVATACNKFVPNSGADCGQNRSEEHTSELQSRFGISYAVFCLKKKLHTEDANRALINSSRGSPPRSAPSA